MTTGFSEFSPQSGSGNPWWNTVLQHDELAQYYSARTQGSPALAFASQSPSRQRYFQQGYQDVYADYLGNIGTSYREGQDPISFMDYLQTNDPWTARYSSLPQTSRGTTGMYTNPRPRFLYNF